MTIAVDGRLRSAWRDGPLAHRSFRLLAAGQFTSATGDSCYAIALPWLILTGHGSPALLGTVLACYGYRGPPSYALLPPGQLQAGNAIASAMAEGGSLIGPALGGPLISVAGPASAFAADAASFAVSAATLALMPARRAQRVVRAPWPGGRSGGLRALIRGERLLQVMLAMVIVANLASDGTLEVATPALAHARYGVIGYGTMMACLAAGSVGGNLAGLRGRGAGQGGKMAWSTPAVRSAASFVLEGVAIMVLPYLGGLPGAATASCVLGLANGYGNVLFITLLQQWAPPALLGRVMSLVMLAAWGMLPLSAGVAGALVLRFGPAPYFPVAGAVVTAAVVGALTQREFRSLGVAAELPARTVSTRP